MELCEFKIILIIAGLNLFLSALHKFLEYIKDKTKTNLDNRIYALVSFLLTTIEWLMANRKKCK